MLSARSFKKQDDRILDLYGIRPGFYFSFSVGVSAAIHIFDSLRQRKRLLHHHDLLERGTACTSKESAWFGQFRVQTIIDGAAAACT